MNYDTTSILETPSFPYFVVEGEFSRSLPKTYQGKPIVMISSLDEIPGYLQQQDHHYFKIGLSDSSFTRFMNLSEDRKTPPEYQALDEQLLAKGVYTNPSDSNVVDLDELLSMEEESRRLRRSA